jgi:hypothetical protein
LPQKVPFMKGAAPALACRAAMCALILLMAGTALGQEVRWKLPDRGAARYQRKLEVEEQVAPKEAWVPSPWQHAPAAAVVLAGELDSGRQRPVLVPGDVRELFAFLCFDLSRTRTGKVHLEMPGREWLGPMWIEATYGDCDPAGNQSVEAKVVSLEPKAGSTEVVPRGRLHGTLRGTRRIDPSNGRLAECSGQGDLELQMPAEGSGPDAQPARRLRLRITDSWTFAELLEPGSPAFTAAVAEGIRAAVEHLLRALPGREARLDMPFPVQDVQPGELALTLLALVKGGADPKSEVIAAAYDDLRQRPMVGTYSLAAAILAIEALYASPREWQDLHEGRLQMPTPRHASDGDRALLQKWTSVLLRNVDITVNPGEVRRWRYGPSADWDNSNTQFALLGLYAAQLCGVEIPEKAWTAAARHLLQCKVPAGEAGAPRIVTYAELEPARTGRTHTATRTACLGWAYASGSEPTGSMTAAGITGLSLCAAGLRAQKKGSAKLLHDVDDGVRSGLLWLERHLDVRRNPGPPSASARWLYYWLYGLERCCEFNLIAQLGERDWYFDGALQLLGQQAADGGWGEQSDTCFALLFLKKAALPPVTGR